MLKSSDAGVLSTSSFPLYMEAIAFPNPRQCTQKSEYMNQWLGEKNATFWQEIAGCSSFCMTPFNTKRVTAVEPPTRSFMSEVSLH